MTEPEPPTLGQLMAAKWGEKVDASSHIFTWTNREELSYLMELASGANWIVESGCYLGRSAKVMLDAGNAHLWTVDHFAVAGTEHTTRHFLRDEIAAGRAELIIGDSSRAQEMLAPHMTGKIDLIWVDDGHAEEDVLRDIRCLLPLLRSGGTMIGHDFEIPYNDVARGVMRSGIAYSLPMPRIWSYTKI